MVMKNEIKKTSKYNVHIKRINQEIEFRLIHNQNKRYHIHKIKS